MKKLALIAIVLLITILSACSSDSGNTENAGDTEGSKDKETAESNSESRSVTITDAMGEQTIEGTPKNIVVLEWGYAEDLLALGMQPAGVAGLESYGEWVNAGVPLGENVQNVGTRAEPNLEAIARLDPDLIIGVKFRHEAIASQLKEIAPTVMFAPYSEEAAQDQLQNMIDEFNTIAKIVDKQDKASQVIEDMRATFEEQQARLEEAGISNVDYLISQAFTSQNTPTIRLFTNNSMVAKVMNNMGMNNVYESEQLEVYGYTSTTVETLQNYQDAHFFYIVQEEDNIFANQLAGNPAWENLKFVEEGRTYKMPGSTWTFGGPLSAEVLAKQVADSMLKEQ